MPGTEGFLTGAFASCAVSSNEGAARRSVRKSGGIERVSPRATRTDADFSARIDRQDDGDAHVALLEVDGVVTEWLTYTGQPEVGGAPPSTVTTGAEGAGAARAIGENAAAATIRARTPAIPIFSALPIPCLPVIYA